LFCN